MLDPALQRFRTPTPATIFVTSDTLNLPSARSWRDIPQPVLPRAMSPEGRWRLTKTVMRTTTLVVVCGALGWVMWTVAISLQDNSRATATVAHSTPMKPPELRTDGVLDDAWLARSLALPRNVSLVELDLERLRAKLLANDQVVNATLTRQFPDRLLVQITERSPVARVMTDWRGKQQMLLVSRDGVVFEGTGYDKTVLDSLPWLDGVSLKPDGTRLRPIAGMADVADLLAKARLEAEHLYVTWQIVSLAHLQSDHQVDIRTSNGLTVIFNTRDDFFRQLAKLNYISDQLVRVQATSAMIDLSLGRDVPVTVETTPATPAARPPTPMAEEPSSTSALMPQFGAPAAKSESAFFVFPPTQTRKTQREL